MRNSTVKTNRLAPAYAVQVCMPGQSYRAITKYRANLSDKLDVYLSILRGTHKLSRKGMTVRIVVEDYTDASGPFRVVRRGYVTAVSA